MNQAWCLSLQTACSVWMCSLCMHVWWRVLHSSDMFHYLLLIGQFIAQILVQTHEETELGLTSAMGVFVLAASTILDVLSAGVLSCWHRSDCLIRSHSCTVPEPLSLTITLSLFFFSSFSRRLHLLLSLSLMFPLLPSHPPLPLWFLLVTTSPSHFLSLSILTPGGLSFSFPLPLRSSFFLRLLAV